MKITEKLFLGMEQKRRNKWIERNIMGADFEELLKVPGAKVHIPDYDDANAMMWVIEKLTADGWEFSSQTNDGKSYFVHLGRNKTDDWRKAELHQATADTFALAIYLAAGRALGVIE